MRGSRRHSKHRRHGGPQMRGSRSRSLRGGWLVRTDMWGRTALDSTTVLKTRIHECASVYLFLKRLKLSIPLNLFSGSLNRTILKASCLRLPAISWRMTLRKCDAAFGGVIPGNNHQGTYPGFCEELEGPQRRRKATWQNQKKIRDSLFFSLLSRFALLLSIPNPQLFQHHVSPIIGRAISSAHQS